MEDVSAFRRRAREWVEANVPRADEVVSPEDATQRVEQAKSLQCRIFDAGFGAIAWPKEYGGQELTAAHMRAFTEAMQGHQDPYMTLSVSLGVIGPTPLNYGTSEQKATHLPPLLRGDTLWVQYLSEPSAGSDMAAVLTRAERDGADWVLNGSKVWTTFGDVADYALCLTRTNWDVPKHAGLSMFIVPVRTPGLTVLPLKQASGSQEFCQEYLEDVHIRPTTCSARRGTAGPSPRPCWVRSAVRLAEARRTSVPGPTARATATRPGTWSRSPAGPAAGRTRSPGSSSPSCTRRRSSASSSRRAWPPASPRAFVWLASDTSRYITGVALPVDFGLNNKFL